jgi:hypothetical protein
MWFTKEVMMKRVSRVLTLRDNLAYHLDTVICSDLEVDEINDKIDQCNRIYSKAVDRVRNGR